MADENENVIPAGLPGYVMRKRIEDKATLHKGGMYVGTGEYETITDKKGNTYQVYKTEELPVGKEGQVLMSTVNGIKWEDQNNVSITTKFAEKANVAITSSFSSEWQDYNALTNTLQELIENAINHIEEPSFYIQIQLFRDNQCLDMGIINIPVLAKFTSVKPDDYYTCSKVTNNICLRIYATVKQYSIVWYTYDLQFELCEIKDDKIEVINYDSWKSTYSLYWRFIQ